ncbi:hypothetical protein GMJFJA_GMJFJA_13895, partial [Dysosmobacter welbionis]
VQEGGRGGQQHRQPLCGPSERRGGITAKARKRATQKG